MIHTNKEQAFRIALLDLNNGEENQGMRCLRSLVHSAEKRHGRPFDLVEFDVRQKGEVPDLTFDAYISSGGPGSPLDGKGSQWETDYFNWIDSLWQHNKHSAEKKQALFICHSFQMMARFFELGEVTKRPVQSFGVFPIHKTDAGQHEPLFGGLPDPFFAADFRRWQVVQPDEQRFKELGASILAIEQPFEEVNWERAIMGIRMSPEIIGLQFHPEADPDGMLAHFRRPEQRKKVIRAFCEDRYQRLMKKLREPDFLLPAYNTIIPTFLDEAVAQRHPAVSVA